MAKIGIDARFCTDKATGIGKHVYELIQNLAKLDKANQYIIFLKPDIYESFEVPSAQFRKEKTFAKHYSLAEQTTFLTQLNKAHLDLMIFPHFNAPIFYNKPFVVTIHDLTLHKFPGKKKTDWLSRFAYQYTIQTITQKADHCFAVSHNTKKDMMEILGLETSKITVALNGVSQRFKPLTTKNTASGIREKYHLPENYFLYTGVMRSHKNILGMIKAYHLYRAQNPDTEIPSLVIAGPQDKIYFDEILTYARSLDLPIQEYSDILSTPGLYFPGFLDEADINIIMGQARAFVFPSFYEGFGIPPLEAMQCGVPTITAHTSSLPEACAEATLYFDPLDPHDIADAMRRINDDEKLRQDLIAKGLVQCQQFSWANMTQMMLERYEAIIG